MQPYQIKSGENRYICLATCSWLHYYEKVYQSFLLCTLYILTCKCVQKKDRV